MAQLPEICQESKLLKITNDETKLQLALKDSRIINISEEELKQCLRYVFELIGLRKLPSGELKEFLHAFIRQQYGGHTAAEIRLAFEMAVTGKLDVDPVCYENFSPLYFASIMNAFRPWAVKTFNKLPLEPKAYTKDEIVDIDCDYANYLKNKANKLPVKL